MGWICPMRPSTPLATKRAPVCKKSCLLAVPLIKDWKIADFLKKYFSFSFDFFLGPPGCFPRFLRCRPYSWLAYSLTGLAAPERLNATWAAGKTLILKILLIYGRYGHIHGYRGHIK